MREHEARKSEHDDRRRTGREAGKRHERHEPVDVLRREDLVEGDEPGDRGGCRDDERLRVAPAPSKRDCRSRDRDGDEH